MDVTKEKMYHIYFYMRVSIKMKIINCYCSNTINCNTTEKYRIFYSPVYFSVDDKNISKNLVVRYTCFSQGIPFDRFLCWLKILVCRRYNIRSPYIVYNIDLRPRPWLFNVGKSNRVKLISNFKVIFRWKIRGNYYFNFPLITYIPTPMGIHRDSIRWTTDHSGGNYKLYVTRISVKTSNPQTIPTITSCIFDRQY